MTKDQQIAELKEKIAELEEVIYEYQENDMGVVVSDTEKKMLKIIADQIDRLMKESEVESLLKDDVKNFDTYVKDLVAIRGKMPTPKSNEDKEVQKSEADILKLINGD